LWCSGKLIGWVTGLTFNDALQKYRDIVAWYGGTYDHDKFGAMMELIDGEKRLKQLVEKEQRMSY